MYKRQELHAIHRSIAEWYQENETLKQKVPEAGSCKGSVAVSNNCLLYTSFGLTCAKKYGGIYVPPRQVVIHQFAREMLACGGAMILGSDSHTRYGALGTIAMGEGGPELVKQLSNQTCDINMPGVIGIYMTGEPIKGVGPQDVALAIIGAVFQNGYVNNKVMERCV